MDKKFGICVCLAVGLLKTLIAADVDDPCKAVNTESKVATMCKETSGTEEIYNGLINVDSVVLRVQTQAENCICRVSIFNQTSERRLYVRKFNDLTSSAPTNADCGLYIDAYFTGQSSNQLTSFMCSNSILFNTFIKPNSELEFNSRLAYGSFISGYCIEVYKDYSSSSQDELRIKCDLKRDEAILNTTIGSTTSSTTIVLTTAYAGDLTQSEVQHTTDSSGTTNDATSIKPLTDNIEKNATMYIVIGGCGGLLMILIPFIIAIVYKRKKATSSKRYGYQNDTNQMQQPTKNLEYDGLKDNDLYVPSKEHELDHGNYEYSTVDSERNVEINRNDAGGRNIVVFERYRSGIDNHHSDGNYCTVDIDEHVNKKIIKTELDKLVKTSKAAVNSKLKTSNTNAVYVNDVFYNSSELTHSVPPNGSGIVYAVVNKKCKIESAGGIDEIGKECSSDQTYAVVNKTNKIISSEEETNKK